MLAIEEFLETNSSSSRHAAAGHARRTAAVRGDRAAPFVLGWAAVVVFAASGALAGCAADPDPAPGCEQVQCDPGATDGGTGACTTERGSRQLLDNFDAPGFAFERAQTVDGRPIDPPAFNWKTPSSARAITCALFASMPTFACGAIANFRQAVALYDFRRFEGADPREGTFDLAAARSQEVMPSPDYRTAGCWAYSLTKVVGATPLIQLTPTEVPLPSGGGASPDDAGE